MKYIGILFSVLILSSSTYAANGMFMVVKGDVKVSGSGGGAVVAKVGTKVNQGDQIITGLDSRAKIVMSDRNIINVSPNTKVIIEEYVNDAKSKNVKLGLLEGKIRTNVEQKYDNDKNKFEIRTPTAVAGVRGTQFITSYSEATKKTEVITLQGQVEFRNIVAGNSTGAKEEKVVVEKGEQSSVGSGGAPPEPPKRVPADVIKEVERETNVKNKEAPSAQNPPPPPASQNQNGKKNPNEDKPPLVEGAIGNKFDKTKVKVVPQPPTTSP